MLVPPSGVTRHTETPRAKGGTEPAAGNSDHSSTKTNDGQTETADRGKHSSHRHTGSRNDANHNRCANRAKYTTISAGIRPEGRGGAEPV